MYFFDVIHEQRPEVFPITEPYQGPEFLIEFFLDYADLSVNTFPTVLIYSEDIIQEKDWELVWPNNLDFIRAEKLQK